MGCRFSRHFNVFSGDVQPSLSNRREISLANRLVGTKTFAFQPLGPTLAFALCYPCSLRQSLDMQPTQWIPIVVLASAIQASAATTCSVATDAGSFNTSDSTCGLSALAGDSGSAQATSSVFTSVSGNAVIANVSASAQASPTLSASPLDGPQAFVNSAAVSFSDIFSIYVSGTGTGYLVASDFGGSNIGPGADAASVSLSVGPVTLICGNNFACLSTATPIAITLGQTYTVDLQGSASAQSGEGLGDGSAFGNGTFSFYAADGVTPVAVSAAPEPATYALLILAGVTLLWAKRMVG